MKLAQLGYTCIKPQKSRVYIPLELADEAYNKVAKHTRFLEQAAKVADKDVLFVPKGENVLMNFGPNTAYLDMQASDNKIMDDMHELIRRTYTTLNVKKGGDDEKALGSLYSTNI